jgi:hypothetical protein
VDLNTEPSKPGVQDIQGTKSHYPCWNKTPSSKQRLMGCDLRFGDNLQVKSVVRKDYISH